MASTTNNRLFKELQMNVGQDIEANAESRNDEDGGEKSHGVLGWLSHEIFRKDCLHRRLERHHITGIAFSGAVGIGLHQTSGEIITLGGPVGAFIAYIFAGLLVFSVMRCLAEMVSVRPVTAPIIDFPHTFVDEALGFAVGTTYWLANCTSMVTLTIAAAMFTQYWKSSFSMTSAIFVLLLALFLMNACGIQLYGRMEWVFKWLKILLILGLCLVMILVKAGVGPGFVDSNFEISPGYSSIGFSNDQSPVPISGTGGRILAVLSCTTLAMFQFMGGEIVLVTSGEAKSPRRDLPTAARYMYLLPVSFYLVAILLVGLNVNYLDPRLYHSHIARLVDTYPEGIQTASTSPFVIAIENAGIRGLPGFLDACFLFSALTAANSALYVSSRTLFVIAQRSNFELMRSTLGRTNNGHTPLAAISASFLFGGLAFLAVKSQDITFQEAIHVFGRLYTGSILCVYASECLAFLRFMAGIKFYHKTINRDGPDYRKNHYRAHWQPLWAILGLVLCTLLMILSGWAAIYDMCVKSKGVDRRDSIIDLVAAYLGPLLFFAILIVYKLVKRTNIVGYEQMSNVWFPTEVPDETDVTTSVGKKGKRNRVREFLSWIK